MFMVWVRGMLTKGSETLEAYNKETAWLHVEGAALWFAPVSDETAIPSKYIYILSKIKLTTCSIQDLSKFDTD